MTALVVERPTVRPATSIPADERLYDWEVDVPGAGVPPACGIARTLPRALYAAQLALTRQPCAAIAHVWAADLGLTSGRGYRREPWPRWTVRMAGERLLTWSR